MHSRKTLLFSDGELLVKNDDQDDFDVTDMWELVGTYLLNQLKVFMANENIGLCIYNGLGMIFKNMSGPEVERNKKELIKIFKNDRLSIIAKTNKKTAHILDIHFDLVKEIYQSYKKPNDDP